MTLVGRVFRTLAFSLVLVASAASAATATFSVGLDTDNDVATGCTLVDANGPVAGIEWVATAFVTTSPTGATVTRLERQACVAGVLGAASIYESGPWPVGIGNGIAGSAVIEIAIPLSFFPASSSMRAVVLSDNGAGGQDATLPFSLVVTQASATPVVPVPLSPWLVLPLSLLLVVAAVWWRRRHPEQTALLVLLVFVAGSGLVWAATVIRDGTVGDWADVAPAVTDAAGDAPVDADILAVFTQQDGTNLYFRIDADVRTEAVANLAPIVNAGTSQTITLPGAATLSGSATDDGLPNPPATLTYAWAKVSGPGTVSFGNAANAITTASFGAAGSYVLRLTASDSALAGTADVTVNVNEAGTANQGPIVNAGANQTITLPVAATLAGTATDDGLPNPPGALTTTWSFVSGPLSGVIFGNPALPATTATFAAPGIYVLRLTASDGMLSVSSTVQVTVIDGAPQIAAVADRTVELGNRVQVLLEARDGNANDVLIYTLTTAPAGASLSPAPLIDWMPTAAQLGPHTLTAKVTDSNGNTAITTFNVTVVHTNRPPQLAPQASLITPVGTAFARTLTASDPDAGDTLTFALVSGPSGMTLTGTALDWPTSGRGPGDYAVTVRVTDAAGLSDQKTFTVTLQQSAVPAAIDDNYEVRVGGTLAVPALGVLANDLNPGGRALTARKLSDPSVGSVTSFAGDGAFSYQAPATPPGIPLATRRLWNANATWTYGAHEVVGDLNGDGYPDVVSHNLNTDIRARSGRDGSQLWALDSTGATDCQLMTGGGMNHRVLADVDDSGRPSYVFTTFCGRAESYWHDNVIAFDHLGKVKWVSPPLSKPHPDIRRGATPVPPGGFTPGGLAWRRGLSAARLTANDAPVLLMRAEITNNDGYTLYVDEANQYRYAGCRAVTGFPADENRACRATLIISGADGSVRQTLVAPNPTGTGIFGGPDALKELPPIALDIDGDGRVDLVSGTEVWKQNAASGFDLAWQLTTPVNDTAVADLDGDGMAEIIHLRSSAANPDDQRGIFVYTHDGELKRRIPLQTYWFTPLTIADVDGDGRSDIVLGAEGTLYAFRDDGRPIWAYKVPDDVPDNPILAPYYTNPAESFRISSAAPQVYDLDGDGVAEIVFSAHSRIVILDGRTGLRKVDPYWTFSNNYTDLSALMLVDINNDGQVDIVQNGTFTFNCGFTGFPPGTCDTLVGPISLSGGTGNSWLPGPKAWPHLQYRSSAIDDTSRLLHDTKVSRVFRTPEQQGTVRDPRLAQAASFTYEADDGAATSAPARVIIAIAPDNKPPVFTSTPPKSLWQRFAPTPPGGLVTHYYDVTALDPDQGDTVTFSLKSAPAWVTMSGPARIRFEPTCGSYGYPCPWGWTTVIVTATDSRGASSDQIFIVNLTTTSVTVPNVVGLSVEAASAALVPQDLQGLPWIESFSALPVGTVLAQDAVAGAVVGRFDDIRLTVSKGAQPVHLPFVVGQQLAAVNSQLVAAGLTVNVSTTFSTTIPAGEIMSQSPAFGTELLPATAPPVELTVSAGGPLPAPIASIVLEPGTGSLLRLVGDEPQYKAIAILTDGTSADVTLTAAWLSSLTGVATVNVAGVAKAVGAGATTISASLSGKTGQATLNVASRALGDNTPPTAAITSPADGASVTGPTAIVGTASDANFLRYELAIALAGDDNYTVIAEGTTAVTNGTLGTIDPTVLVNDQYTLRLTVFDRSENESVATTTVQLAGNRKVGLFTLTYQDLNIPAAGIPLTVSRTYDSRDKAVGDFGIGWRLGLQTLRIRTNRVPGTGWIRTVQGPTVTLKPTSEHRVSVTLPDGRVDVFDMVVSPTSNIGSLDFTNVTGFQPRVGTLGKLEALGNNGLLIVNGGAEVELVDDSTLQTYSPALYRYTSLDGTKIDISPAEGVKKVTDPNGNAVTFGPGGILHSDGAGIVFTRDARGRIVAVTDLLGNVQTYAYDGNGDLVTHTNPVGGVTRFAYDGRHGLIEIRDASGNRAARNEYDASGRLVAVIDANGKRVEFSHDDAAQEDVITDRLGGVLRLQYDANGNVVGTEQAVTIEGSLVNAITTMTYDGQGNEASRIDPDGKRVNVAYSGVLPTAKVVDPAGLALSSAFAYNARSDPVTAVDSGGRSYAFDYDANGNLVSFDVPDVGAGTSLANAQGLISERRDVLGTTTTFTRDGAGNVVREEVREASNTLLRRMDFTYDANGNKAGQTLHRTINGVSTPLTTQFGYDAANRLVRVTDPLGGVTRTEYDADGRETAQIDALGRRTTFAYDSLGLRTRTTYPDGTFDALVYDANGNISQQTDRAGRATAFTYDELNRNVATTLQNGDTTRTIYSAAGRIAATVDANGNRTDYAYDTAGRSVGVSLPAVVNGVAGPPVQPKVLRTLNGLGAPTTVTDANGRVSTMLYDTAGRLVQTNHPDGSNSKQTFDALGRRTSVVNEEGQQTSFSYDGLGRLVAASGLSGDATYGYDEAGNLVTQTDALGRVTRMRYDALNRPVEKQYPGGEIEQSAYDAVGNVVALMRPDGKTITFAYDAMNRMVRKSLPGGAQVDYTYQPDGQRATVTDARGVTAYAYDAVGRLASVTHPTGEVVEIARDANGNLKSLASPAATISYDYDALNRLVQVIAPEGISRSYYDLVGNRVRNSLANGMASDAVFDTRNRVTQLFHRAPSNAILRSFANGYSPAGRRTQTTEDDGSITTFGYDAKGRLASESRTGAAPYAISHVYDAVGNRTQLTGPVGPVAFTYDSNDRLLSRGTTTYGYDANGNRSATTSGTQVTQYSFDAEDRLVTLVGADVANQYAYDADGQLVLSSGAAGVARFLPDRSNGSRLSQVLEERDGSGSLRARYSYGNELLAMARGGAASVYLRDGLGSVRGLADASGTITDRYQYDAYGNTLSAAGATANPYRFMGERFDGDGSLYQLRARYYDPAAGRFLSRDPFGGRPQSPVSLHRYLYANADPVNFSDPTGRETLLNITLTQALSSFVDSSIALKDVQQLCTAKGMADQVQSLVATSQQFVALAGLAAAGVFASGLVTDGKGGAIDFAYVSEDFPKESLIKNFQLQLKGGGNQLALGFQMSNHSKSTLKAAVTMLPPPLGVNVGGAVKTAFTKSFVYCGVAELGKMALESEVSGGFGVDGKGAFLGLGWSNTIEASLFRGALNVSWPIVNVSSKNNSASINLLGVWGRTFGER